VKPRDRIAFLFGVLFSCMFMACAGAGFIKYYGLQSVAYDHGTLSGPSQEDDLPFSKCAENPREKFPCVVMFSKDFFALKQDYEDTKQKLKECERK
jgi:hypothetical protein